MAKNDKKKIDKDTRKLLESMSELIKKNKKSDNKKRAYKFKTNNKAKVKKLKKSCLHWTIRDNKLTTLLTKDITDPNKWKCQVCDASFPVKVYDANEIVANINDTIMMINQLQAYAMQLGGDSEFMKNTITAKSLLTNIRSSGCKISQNVQKKANQNNAKYDRDDNGAMGLYNFGG